MPAIKILQIKRQAVVTDQDFEFIQRHLGKWLPLFDITFDADGELSHLTTRTDNGVACVFPKQDDYVTYELAGIGLTNENITLEFVVTCSKCGKETTVTMTEAEYGTPIVNPEYLCEDCV